MGETSAAPVAATRPSPPARVQFAVAEDEDVEEAVMRKIQGLRSLQKMGPGAADAPLLAASTRVTRKVVALAAEMEACSSLAGVREYTAAIAGLLELVRTMREL